MDTLKAEPQSSDTVSQSEVERLLAMVGDAESTAAVLGPSGKTSTPQHDLLSRHEFPQLSSFSAGELRKLRMQHEEYIRSLAAQLSIYLRLECGLQMSKLETVRFQNFLDGLSSPTFLSLFRLDPLDGTCFLDIPPKLGLCIVDRELGGPARNADEPRDLSKMEGRLLSRVVEMIASEWCAAWRGTLDLRPTLLRNENDGRFLQTHPPDSMMLVLGIEVRLAEIVEQIQLCLPHSTLAPLVAKLNSETENAKEPVAAQSAKPLKWNSVFDGVELQVTAELPDVEITAQLLGHLRPGDLIPITPEMVNRVQICLAGSPKFSASLGACGKQMAVKISQALKV